MAVVIEELQVEDAAAPPRAQESTTASHAAPADERRILELLARNAWCARRLFAD